MNFREQQLKGMRLLSLYLSYNPLVRATSLENLDFPSGNDRL